MASVSSDGQKILYLPVNYIPATPPGPTGPATRLDDHLQGVDVALARLHTVASVSFVPPSQGDTFDVVVGSGATVVVANTNLVLDSKSTATWTYNVGTGLLTASGAALDGVYQVTGAANVEDPGGGSADWTLAVRVGGADPPENEHKRSLTGIVSIALQLPLVTIESPGSTTLDLVARHTGGGSRTIRFHHIVWSARFVRPK